MKKLFIPLIFVLLAASVNAQKSDVSDTIRVAALQKFTAPSVGALVLGNILKLKYTAELLNEKREKIRPIKNITQRPKQEDFSKSTSGGRGTTVWMVFSDMIETPGIYFVKISIDANGELGALKADRYYMIKVSNPVMASKIELRKTYFPGEKETFSFATLEYTDINAYSYEIKEQGGAVLMQGTGPIVKLDSVLKNPLNVGKKISISGMYQGKPFEFSNPVTQELEKSSWEFSVEKPGLEEFSQWEKKENDQWLVSVYNSQAKSFWYIYIGNTPNGFAVSSPEINGLRVTSDPENFIQGASQRRSASFKVIDLNINQEFLDNMKPGDEQKVKVTVNFRTQFGEQIKRDYYAVVIK